MQQASVNFNYKKTNYREQACLEPEPNLALAVIESKQPTTTSPIDFSDYISIDNICLRETSTLQMNESLVPQTTSTPRITKIQREER